MVCQVNFPDSLNQVSFRACNSPLVRGLLAAQDLREIKEAVETERREREQSTANDSALGAVFGVLGITAGAQAVTYLEAVTCVRSLPLPSSSI